MTELPNAASVLGKASTQKEEDIGKKFTLKFEVCYGPALNKALKKVPPMLASRREQMSIKARKAQQKPIEVAAMVGGLHPTA